MRLIDADVVTGTIRHAIKVSQSPWNHYGWFQKTVDEAETIDAQPVKHGHWDFHPNGYFECNLCGMSMQQEYDFCPHCGAKMDGEQDA